MRLIEARHLSGPNVYTASPVSVARLELDELTGRESTDYPGFSGRLTSLLPGLAGHHCAAGRPGGFCQALARGTYFGHIAEHVALELSSLAGREACLGKTLWAGADGRYDVVTECPADEPASSRVPELLLRSAIGITEGLLAGREPDFAGDLAEITRLAERERLGVSTAAIAAAARRRGIPVRRTGALSMLRLGYGSTRRLVCAALTEQTSAVDVDIAADKMLAKQVLGSAGIPVAAGVVAATADEAAAALEQLGAPVVIKPLGGNHGRSVTVGIESAEEAAAAFSRAATGGSAVLVERFVSGRDYRVLVIDGQVAAAAQLRPAAVTGDGTSTISELVAAVNADPRRGDGHARELTRIVLDAEVLAHLAAAGLDAGSVPPSGQLVTLRHNANLSTGGTSADVTDLVHPEVAAMCCRAAAVAGLDICGVDVRLADIAAPLHGPGHEEPGAAGPGGAAGAVLELNACPGLRMHLAPTDGQPRDVAAAIVDMLYPPGAPERIPVIAVTGTNGKTTTVRMIGHVLRQAGLAVGMTTTDGVFSGGRLIYAADASGPRSADMVLDDPAAEVAVLETARGGILRGGLAYDRADIAVVTNITADHLGDGCVDDMDELIHVKALVAEEVATGGTVVLNADDPAAAALAGRPAVRASSPVLRLCTQQPTNSAVEQHRAAGGLVYEVAGGELVECEGGTRRPMISLAELPGAFGGRAAHLVANALAAIAACRAAGISAKDIRRGLATFTPAQANPGRGNLFRAGDSPVLVDYGHNAAALTATGAMISGVWGGPGTPGCPAAAVTLPGDRRDDLIEQTAEAIAAWCPAVAIYEDADKRGRAPGEMQDLITAALRRARPGITVTRAAGPEQALRDAVRLAGGGPVLFLYEKLAAAHEALAAIGAQPWPDGEPGSGTAAREPARTAGRASGARPVPGGARRAGRRPGRAGRPRSAARAAASGRRPRRPGT
nr:cyanophycin synthetase [Streptosporangiaceae bacterium]